MGWLYPTSYTDTDGWTNPTYAYDGNTGTAATISVPAESAKTLIFNHSAITCSKINRNVGYLSGSVDFLTIDVYKVVGGWTTIYSSTSSPNNIDTDILFGPWDITNIRVILSNSNIKFQRTAYIYEIKYWEEIVVVQGSRGFIIG